MTEPVILERQGAIARLRGKMSSEPGLQIFLQAAQDIIDGFARGDFEIHFPRRFTRVLKALQWLPRRLYFALIRRATGL